MRRFSRGNGNKIPVETRENLHKTSPTFPSCTSTSCRIYIFLLTRCQSRNQSAPRVRSNSTLGGRGYAAPTPCPPDLDGVVCNCLYLRPKWNYEHLQTPEPRHTHLRKRIISSSYTLPVSSHRAANPQPSCAISFPSAPSPSRHCFRSCLEMASFRAHKNSRSV